MSGKKLMDEIFDRTEVEKKERKPPPKENLQKARAVRKIKQELKDQELKIKDPLLYQARMIEREKRAEREKRLSATVTIKKTEPEVAPEPAPKKEPEPAPVPAPKKEPEPAPAPKKEAQTKFDFDIDLPVKVDKPKQFLQDNMEKKPDSAKRSVYNPFLGTGSLF